MKKKLDFSKATQREPIKIEDIEIPFYLEKDIRVSILKKAKELKIDPRELVHILLRNGMRDITDIEKLYQ